LTHKTGIQVTADEGPGVLHQLSGVMAAHRADITSVEIVSPHRTYFELELPDEPQALVDALQALPIVREALVLATMEKIYGKRIIIMGGGAQVAQVAMGAIIEADRHNIRGEHISVDTIPLVGELPLAEAVRAAARLPRVKALVMAGALMGGEITRAVQDVRAQGLMVVSLNMAGSVPEASDLVVSDPVQAGVMTVMAVAETAKFSLAKLKRREF
jgi:energy-converting hydrogenase B subunit Q